MTSVMRLTCLTIGVVLLKEVSCGSFTKPKGSTPPELPALPRLPGWPELPALPPLPGWPKIPFLPPLPEIPNIPWLPFAHILTLPETPSPETLKMVTPETKTFIYPDNFVSDISSELPSTTVAPEISTVAEEALETSTTLQFTTEGWAPLFTTTEASKTSETEIPDTSTKMPGGDTSCETESLPDDCEDISTSSFPTPSEIPETTTTLPQTPPDETESLPDDISTSSFPTPSEIPDTTTTLPQTSPDVTPDAVETETSAEDISTSSFPTPSEIPDTTTTLPQTSPDETTNTAVDPANFCPDNQSLLSERDLEVIVKFNIDTLNLAELLNESFYAETVSIKDAIKEDLQEFLKLFIDRPAHLKHILERLTIIRSKMEQSVSRHNDKLPEYTVLENEYNAKNERIQKLSKRIENSKQICKLNCDDVSIKTKKKQSPNSNSVVSITLDRLEERDVKDIFLDSLEEGGLREILKSYTGDRYVCGYIDDVANRIKNILLHKLNSSMENLKHDIIRDSKTYKDKVKDFKTSLKSIALSQFGVSMYDILNLQDQYHHFDELLTTDVHQCVIRIKRQFGKFESEIMEVETGAERLRNYCYSCSMPLRRSVRAGDSAFKDQPEKTDLVEYVTDKIYENISKQAYEVYHSIFKDLEPIFAEWELIDEKIANLQPIQKEIARMTEEETEELNKLKKAFPKSSVASVVELDRKAKELNDKVDAIKNELGEI